MKKATTAIFIIILVIVLITVFAIGALYKSAREETPRENDIEETENDVEDNEEDIYENDIDEDEDEDIRVTAPQPNEEVSFPLTVSGEARGNWFFEAEVNLRLLDNEGKEVAAGFALSQDEDWMTMDFVAFEGEIAEVPEGVTGGTLIIEENNPASPEERGREVWTYEVPVNF